MLGNCHGSIFSLTRQQPRFSLSLPPPAGLAWLIGNALLYPYSPKISVSFTLVKIRCSFNKPTELF